MPESNFLEQEQKFRVCGYVGGRWFCWQEAIGTILRIAVPAVGMRIIRFRMRIRIMVHAGGYGFYKGGVHVGNSAESYTLVNVFNHRQNTKT